MELPHDFAAKGVLNVLVGVLPTKVIFAVLDSVAFTPGCKLATFYHL